MPVARLQSQLIGAGQWLAQPGGRVVPVHPSLKQAHDEPQWLLLRLLPQGGARASGQALQPTAELDWTIMH